MIQRRIHVEYKRSETSSLVSRSSLTPSQVVISNEVVVCTREKLVLTRKEECHGKNIDLCLLKIDESFLFDEDEVFGTESWKKKDGSELDQESE